MQNIIDPNKHGFDDDESLVQKATSTAMLQTRLELNKKCSSNDFIKWLFDKLQVRENEDVLDVGCGTGSQALQFIKLVGSRGSVSCVDISSESIATLRSLARESKNLDAIVSDMSDLRECIDTIFKINKYDLVHSSYSIYYSDSPNDVLRTMKNSLKNGGRMAIFVPTAPHDMVEFVRECHAIPSKVDESLKFAQVTLEPFFKKNFYEVEINTYCNTLRIEKLDDFVSFYRATTYCTEEGAPLVISKAQETLAMKGYLEFNKRGCLIIGKRTIKIDNEVS